MDFSLTSEQRLLQDSAARFSLKRCGFEQYQRSLSHIGHSDPGLWSSMADFGWLALPIPESFNGLGGTAVDVCLVSEALGKGMAIEPFVTGVVAPLRALIAAGAADQQAALFRSVASGELQLALAYSERGAPLDPAICSTVVCDGSDGFRLTGEKHCVLNAPNADKWIVSARMSSSTSKLGKVVLLVVDARSKGVEMTSYPIIGGGVAADLRFNEVPVNLGACLLPGDAPMAIEEALGLGSVASCAQALGAMQVLFERTLEYAQTRKQFGVAIGSFQVIQHRLVEMAIEVEQSRSMVIMAANKVDICSRTEWLRASSAAKAYLGKASKFVAQQAVQLHGGIGVTEELEVGHCFRQLTGFGAKFGDRNYHIERVASFADTSS